jgi:putative ABC transport system permease protein
LLIESLILAIAGGAFGVLLATWGVNLLTRLNTGTLSRMEEVNVDTRVLGFTLLVTLSVGILFGLFPALQGSDTDLGDALKKGGRALSGGAGGRLRRLLVVAEVALAFMVLIGAGLTLKSFGRLTSVDPGFDPRNVLTFRMRLPDAKYREMSQALAFGRAAMSRVSTLPGVERVAVSTGFPLGRASDTDYIVEGQTGSVTGRSPVALRQDISEDYYKVLDIPLLEGRLFTAHDTETTPLVLIVDEELVARSFPNRSLREVIGKRLRFLGEKEDWREIVGVVKHVKQNSLDEESRAQIYRPLTQITSRSGASFARATDMIVKTSVEPYSLIGAIKNEIRAIDKDQPIAQVQTLDDKLSDSVAPQRFTIQLLGLFGVIAMLLAAAGIYGVMSYAVTQRTHEIGIRMALGAQVRDVLRLVVKGGMALTVSGVAIGLGGAMALTRLMSKLLFGVTPTDPLTFVCVAFGLTLVALIACYIPARRATKVDPLVALRYE